MKYTLLIFAVLFAASSLFFRDEVINFGATVLSTASSDTLNTFRTNVNTSLENINTSLIGKVGTSSAETQGYIPYWTSTSGTPATVGSVSTTTATLSSSFSYSGTLGALVGGIAGTLKSVTNQRLYYATTTAWAGTTTVAFEVGYGDVLNTAKCFTDTGTVNVHIGYGTASTSLFNASTTIGTITFASNNTMTAGVKVVADIGTPASSPKSVVCTVNSTL